MQMNLACIVQLASSIPWFQKGESKQPHDFRLGCCSATANQAAFPPFTHSLLPVHGSPQAGTTTCPGAVLAPATFSDTETLPLFFPPRASSSCSRFHSRTCMQIPSRVLHPPLYPSPPFSTLLLAAESSQIMKAEAVNTAGCSCARSPLGSFHPKTLVKNGRRSSKRDQASMACATSSITTGGGYTSPMGLGVTASSLTALCRSLKQIAGPGSVTR